VKVRWKTGTLLTDVVRFGFAVARTGPGDVIRDLEA
jgi:hypothetical protein